MKDIDILVAFTDPTFALTATPVQQGLFSKHAYEEKSKPKERTLSDDERQEDMFAPKEGHDGD